MILSENTFFCLVSISLCLAGCSDVPSQSSLEQTKNTTINADSEALKTTIAENAQTDYMTDLGNILGSWHSISYEQDGRQDPTGAGLKFVITEKVLNIGGAPNWYLIDTSTSPKELDFNTGSLEKPFAGIYKLEGEALTICYADTAGASRPTAFTTVQGDGKQLLICRRCKVILLNAANINFDPSLKNTIDEAIELLDKNEIEKFLNRVVSADELQTIKQAEWNQTVKYVRSQRKKHINTLRVLPKLIPVINDNQTVAVFDLTKIHIVDGVAFPQIRFVKTNGKWYLRNR